MSKKPHTKHEAAAETPDQAAEAPEPAETTEPAAGDDKSFAPSQAEEPAAAQEAPEAASEAPAADGEADRLVALEAELADAKDKLLRALAEAENVRRRAARDREDLAKRANASFAKEMLAVADNFRRALQSADETARAENEAYAKFVEGVEMIEKTMQAAFERQGVKVVDALGKRFDPRYHEAMYEYDDPSQPAGTVGQVLEAGYVINDLLLRPAKVGVTKGGPAAPVEAKEPADESATTGGQAYESGAGEAGSRIDEEL